MSTVALSKGARINRCIDSSGVGPYQLLVLVLAGGIYAAEGALLLLVGMVAKGVVVEWTLSPLHASSVALSVFLGLTLGTISGGMACDVYGRRRPIMITYLGIIIFLLFCILSNDFILLAIGKALLGFFMGFGLPGANALVCESCPASQRSNIYSSVMVLFACGQMYAAGAMWWIDPQLSHEKLPWRTLLGLGMVLPGVLLVASYFLLLESCHWQILNGRKEAAKAGLRRMAQWNGRSDECEDILSKWDDVNDDSPSDAEGADEEKAERKRTLSYADGEVTPLASQAGPDAAAGGPAAKKEDKESGCGICWRKASAELNTAFNYRLRSLFSRYYRRTTLIMTFVCFSSNLSYYGMIYGLPHTFQSIEAESKAQVAENSEASGQGWSPAAGVFFAALFEVPGIFIAMLLGSTISRKANLCFAFLMSCVCLATLVHSISTHQMDTIGVWAVFCAKMFIASGFIIAYLYLLEIYPTYFRATGLAFSMVVGRIGAFSCPFLYDGLIYSGHGYVFFFATIGVFMGLSSVLVLFLPFETKDAPLTEI